MESPEQSQERRNNNRRVVFALVVYFVVGYIIYALTGAIGLDEEIRNYATAIYSIVAIFGFEWLGNVYDKIFNGASETPDRR